MKKILIIMPSFYGYEKKIQECYEKQGYFVDIIRENFYSVILKYKIISKLFFINKDRLFYYYYIKNIDISKKYDDIVVIRGSSVTKKVMEYVKSIFPDAKYHMYQWDSVQNNPNALRINKYFDTIQTFDMKDAEKFGWSYRPLFFINEAERTDRKILFSYICVNHSDRIKILNLIKEKFKDKPIYIYFYIGALDYFVTKYIKRNANLLRINKSDLYFHPLPVETANDIMSNCDIIVDYTNPNQDGFSMRTIEAMVNRCKLITNNRNIKDADFYNSNNIYIYDINDFSIPNEFLKHNYEEIDSNVRNNYSLSTWCMELIG